MNGAHRESHHPACPLLPRRRRLRPAHPLQTACFPKPRLFIFTLFSRCLFSLLRSGLPFFLRSLFLSHASPRSTLSARESGVRFPARSKTPLRSLLRPGCSFSFLLNPGLSVVISCPFPFCLSPLTLPPFASMPSCPSSLSSSLYLLLLALPPFSSIPADCCHLPLPFCLSCPCFRLSPQCHPVRRHFSSSRYLPLLALPPFSPIPADCCHLPLPLGLSRLCFFLFPHPFFTAGKRAKKVLPLRKRLSVFGSSRSDQ